MESPPAPPPLKLVLEALLFSAQKALTTRDLRDLLLQAAQDETAPEARGWRKVKDELIEETLAELERDHAVNDRSFRLVCVAGAWRFAGNPAPRPPCPETPPEPDAACPACWADDMTCSYGSEVCAPDASPNFAVATCPRGAWRVDIQKCKDGGGADVQGDAKADGD